MKAETNRFFSKSDWLVLILVPFLFFLVIFLFHPFRETFQYNTDEGVELIKSMLVAKGHHITGDVWSDHPPLFNNLLAFVFSRTSFSVNVARLITLSFSVVLIGMSATLAQLIWGRGVRNFVYLLLPILPRYIELSISVMIGLPAISLSMAALLGIVLWHRQGGGRWLILAGISMSLSIFIKVFTAFLLPVFGLGLILGEWVSQQGKINSWRRIRWWRLFKHLLVFCLSFLICSATLTALMLDIKNLSSLIIPHLDARDWASGSPISQYLQASYLFIGLAGLGTVNCVVKRKWLAFYLVSWALTAYILLLNQSPVWYHHQLLITIPVGVLAAAGLGEIEWNNKQKYVGTPKGRLKTVAVITVLGVLLTQQLPATIQELDRYPSFSSYGLDPDSGDMRVLFLIQKHFDEGDVMVTDMPMFAFRARLVVPQNLASVSEKRLATGFLTEDDFITAVELEKPPLVIIARFPLRALKAYLEKDYRLLDEIPISYKGWTARIYVRENP